MSKSTTKIKFDEPSHTYHVNGKLTPSVTTMLGATVFKDKYAGISKAVLDNAGRFGTNVHNAIEHDDATDLTMLESLAYEQWLKIKKKHDIKPLAKEQMVHYGQLYVGTFDMIAEIDGQTWLLDVKTTAQLDKDYIGYQETMYEEAYLDMYPDAEEFDKLGVIWIPKGKVGRLEEVERRDLDEIQAVLNEFRDTADTLDTEVFQFEAE